MGTLDDIVKIMGKKKKAPEKVSSVGQKKILIVEDDATIRDMYHDKFLHEGFDVITAVNGKEGLEKTIAEKPNIILLDLMMPVMDGKTMLRRVREIPKFKRLPVVVLTNAGEVENIRETKFYDDACDFLIKSNVEVDAVVNRVKVWLNAFL